MCSATPELDAVLRDIVNSGKNIYKPSPRINGKLCKKKREILQPLILPKFAIICVQSKEISYFNQFSLQNLNNFPTKPIISFR